MDNWTDGYVTEIPYSVNHFPEMAPAHLNLALLHLGLAAPAIEEGFTYLELGFGQGLGLNLLAATHPQGRFFGNDFMPAHVQAAQRLATLGGLDNLNLFEDSFAELLKRDLPPMDYIVLHGIYSWVNAENRIVIISLLRKLLKPGGVVYVSYNCLPGWSAKAPLQRLMSEFAQRQTTGSALERFHAARDLLTALDESEAAFFTNNAPARAALRHIAQASDAYLLHEFAPQGWSPFYHTDVARDMAGADLAFAGSARLFNNFPDYSLPPNTRALLAATSDVGLRELLRDFAMQTQLRRDIFVRGSRPLDAAAVEAQYSKLTLALWRPPASCALRCQVPVGELQLDETLFRPLLESLAAGSQNLQTLLQLPAFNALAPERRIDAINVLLCLDYIGIAAARCDSDDARARARALNGALSERLRAGERISGFASTRLCAAITIAYHDLLFLVAQQAGFSRAEELAAYAVDVVTRHASAAEDGQAVDNAVDERMNKMCHEAQNFLRYGDEFYRSLDMF